jgi:hypothetical protein
MQGEDFAIGLVPADALRRLRHRIARNQLAPFRRSHVFTKDTAAVSPTAALSQTRKVGAGSSIPGRYFFRFVAI